MVMQNVLLVLELKENYIPLIENHFQELMKTDIVSSTIEALVSGNWQKL